MKNTGLYLVMDDRNSHNGITDRFKAIVGLYYIAKCNHVDFHLIHHAGFDMREYLQPNEIFWSAERSDIPLLPWRAAEIKYLMPLSEIPSLEQNKQYVCRHYIGKNIIEIMDVPDWQHIWRELFWELFTPSKIVEDALDQTNVPEHYTAVNVRFINSLGTFENADYNTPLIPEKQEELIGAVLKKVAECETTADSPVVVSSDSVRFLKTAAEAGFRTIDTDGIGHIMNPGIDRDVCLKTFVNFFLLARADKIYSILHADGIPENSLYKSQYPRYAAIVGDKPFVRI